MIRKPVIAIVGRPNVGKSTLFNRLVGKRQSIVEDFPGTTRDRVYGEIEWNRFTMDLVDTGGIVEQDDERSSVITKGLLKQVKEAIEEADLLLFVVDGSQELTAEDYSAVELIRRANKPVLVAVNKLDDSSLFQKADQYHGLGLGEPLPVSALSGKGTGDLLDAMVDSLPEDTKNLALQKLDDQDEGSIRVAIIGRPNTGKSTLVNALAGQDRMIVSEVAGTTRDAIDIMLEHEGRSIILTDTAGIRRPGKITAGGEKYSVLRAQRAISSADIAFIMIDPTEGLAKQDMHIMNYVLENYKSLAILANKWDLVKSEAGERGMDTSLLVKEYEAAFRADTEFIKFAPLITISALKHLRVNKLLDLAIHLYDERHIQLTQKQLKQIIQPSLNKRLPPEKRGVDLRFYKYFQSEINPPTFKFIVNNPGIMHFSYERYLKNAIRNVYPFTGCPIRFVYSKD